MYLYKRGVNFDTNCLKRIERIECSGVILYVTQEGGLIMLFVTNFIECLEREKVVLQIGCSTTYILCYLSLPRKNRAMVPGPVWAPITVPI